MTALPAGWRYIADFGIRQMTATPNAIAANVALGQDALEAESGLVDYIKAQVKLIEGRLTGVKIAGPQAIGFAEAEEACLLFVRHRPRGCGGYAACADLCSRGSVGGYHYADYYAGRVFLQAVHGPTMMRL